MAVRLQLTAGIELLEVWADSAPQAARNIVYEALFAIGDGSAFLVYDIFGDPHDPGNFLVMVKPGLVVKIMVQRANSSFEIKYVGAIDDDLGVRTVQPEVAEPE